MNRLIIAATSSGAGKTMITCGIMRALRNKNIKVMPFKIGADFIDTTYHKIASGKTSTNLDEFMLKKNTIKKIFSYDMNGMDIAIIEGVMGLFDGYHDRYDYCSTASMSKILNSPVVLIVDAGKMSSSAAAIVKGFLDFDKNLNIKGIILNNVSTQNHYDILKSSIKKISDIKILGRIPKLQDIPIYSRHLGLILAEEDSNIDNKISKIADIVEKYIDINALLQISSSPCIDYINDETYKSYDLTLAIAKDKAFNFYYKHSLNAFRQRDVKIIEFDTLNDKKIPCCDGIYIGGGYPEIHAKELSENKELINDILKKSKNNMPIYAECGGLMYLGKFLVTDNNSYEMVGIFDGVSKMSKKLQRFGYCIAKSTKDTIITEKDDILKGHEFHHSIFETKEETVFSLEKKLYDNKTVKWSGGYSYKNTLASYLHINFASNPKITDRFCEKMKAYKIRNKSILN